MFKADEIRHTPEHLRAFEFRHKRCEFHHIPEHSESSRISLQAERRWLQTVDAF